MKVEERAIKRKSFLFIICLYNFLKKSCKKFQKKDKKSISKLAMERLEGKFWWEKSYILGIPQFITKSLQLTVAQKSV